VLILLALIPLALGVVIAVRGRIGVGLAVCALALVLPVAGHVLLAELVVKSYQVPSESMLPTLEVKDRVLVDRTGLNGVDVGDMVVFHPPRGADSGVQCGVPHPPRQACPRPTPEESDQAFLKRVVAGPGDTLSVRNGHPVVNGVVQADEPYASPCGRLGSCSLPLPITIPPGHYFMLGDNRGASDDSRFWGPVPDDWIVGVVIARYSPLGSISTF
jgi:signal peptidase I